MGTVVKLGAPQSPPKFKSFCYVTWDTNTCPINVHTLKKDSRSSMVDMQKALVTNLGFSESPINQNVTPLHRRSSFLCNDSKD